MPDAAAYATLLLAVTPPRGIFAAPRCYVSDACAAAAMMPRLKARRCAALLMLPATLCYAADATLRFVDAMMPSHAIDYCFALMALMSERFASRAVSLPDYLIAAATLPR